MRRMSNAEQFFKILADQTRLRCLSLLVQEGELCVCELTHALDLSQPKISRHLAQLREHGILLDRRQGLWIYYRLHPSLAAWQQKIIADTIDNIRQQTPFRDDLALLKEMPNRPGASCCA